MTSIRTLAAVVAALTTAGIAQAQEATPFQIPMSTSSRDAVIAETKAAIDWRQLMAGNEGPGAIAKVAGSRDRDSVRMEAAAARRALMSAEAQARERQLVGM